MTKSPDTNSRAGSSRISIAFCAWGACPRAAAMRILASTKVRITGGYARSPLRAATSAAIWSQFSNGRPDPTILPRMSQSRRPSSVLGAVGTWGASSPPPGSFFGSTVRGAKTSAAPPGSVASGSLSDLTIVSLSARCACSLRALRLTLYSSPAFHARVRQPLLAAETAAPPRCLLGATPALALWPGQGEAPGRRSASRTRLAGCWTGEAFGCIVRGR